MVDLTLKTFITILISFFFSFSMSAQNEIGNVTINNFDLRGDNNGIFLYNPNSNGKVTISIDVEDTEVEFISNIARLDKKPDRKGELIFLQGSNASMKMVHVSKKKNGQLRLRNIPLWLSLIPPLIAIILALIFKEVVVSLFIGIWSGAFIIGGLRIESLYYFIMSFLEVIQTYIIGALNDTGHLSVIIFSLLIGGEMLT